MQSKQQAGDLPPELTQPAQRALAAAGIQRLEQLTKLTEAEVRQLHGIGPNALTQLRRALNAKGLSFAGGQSNQDAAVTFLQLASGGQVREAYARFVGDGFRHHNPFFEGSAGALMLGMEENTRQNPDKTLEVKRVIAAGEFVVVHSHVQPKPADLGAAVVHIFRFEKGRVVELWDLGQPVPDKSPNQYGMF